MQEWLQDEYEFLIVTRDRDLGDAVAYPNQATGKWCRVGGARVWYQSKPYWSPRGIRNALNGIGPDLLYFQSAFDPALSIVPLILRRLKLISTTLPVLVAPRGEFSEGALSLKRTKKLMYVALAKGLRLYEGVTWHATAQEEAAEIRAMWGGAARVAIAPNLPGKDVTVTQPQRHDKQPNSLRLVFLSRISRKKNLHGALEILRGINARITLDIYGTQEDPTYWSECEKVMERLPGNVRAAYRGPVRPGDVIATLAAYDAFIFPTLGENFGHVILEALLAGCPVLLSDRTPWRDLSDARVGCDIEIDDLVQFRQAIERLVAMDSVEFDQWSRAARAYGERYCTNEGLVENTRRMFDECGAK